MSSNYPGGFANGVTIRGVNLTTTNPGEIFWVNNGALAVGSVGGSDGNDGSYRRPFATVDFAVSKCTANRGDIVLVMPNHNEGGAAAGLFNIDVAGVAVVGLGYKGNRPTFDFDNTATTVIISAANCTLANVNLRASVSDTVTGISVTAGNARIDDVEFLEETSGDNFIDFIETSSTDNATDGLSVSNCKVISADTGNNSFIELNSVHNGLDVVGNHLQLGVASTESIIGTSTATDAITGMYVADNDIFRLYADSSSTPLLFEGTDNACNGTFVRNTFGHADVAGELLISAGSDIRTCQNFGAGLDDRDGRRLPIVVMST